MTKKNKNGRPLKYKESFNDEVDKYLDQCQDSVEEFHKTRGDKSDTYERVQKVKLPTIVGFSVYLGVNETTVYDWAKKYPSFSQSLGRIKDVQHQKLIDGGVSGTYNSTIAKLMLSSNHGYKEKSDITSDDKPVPILGIDFGKEE
jgi:hypothetical protein